MMTIRPLGDAYDEDRLLELWAGAFGADWPLETAWLRSVCFPSTYQPEDHLVAEVNGRPAGFALTQVGKGNAPEGSMLAIGVLPKYRRQGVGRRLHEASIAHLRERRASRVQLGAGALQYFWPGVPAGLPDAWPFFERMGWPMIERSFDLVRSLEGYCTPAWVWERVKQVGIDVITAKQEPAEPALALIEAEMPRWKDYFADYFSSGRTGDVLLALDRSSGGIVGASLLEDNARRWASRFPQPVAAPGAYLVADRWRERGVGMALVAKSIEILQARGCKTAFIGWTWLVDWYGKLGFKVWQSYYMSWKSFTESI